MEPVRPILITGCAGFIGFHVTKRLLDLGYTICGIDNLNDYYDVNLKLDRLNQLKSESNFFFEKIEISNQSEVNNIFERNFAYVIHFAAQAGVRYSLENPMAYINSNIVGFTNILENCRKYEIKHLLYASSSSVYGQKGLPWSIDDRTDQPMSLYAATKKANELMAYSYGQAFGLGSTGLRFFCIYGPWGRPDSAIFKFTKGIIEGTALPVYNFGQMKRDFTYIDDAVDAIIAILQRAMQSNSKEDPALLSRIYNVAKGESTDLLQLIKLAEKHLGAKAILNLMPMQAGDVQETLADIKALTLDYDLRPKVSIEEGLARFISWYQSYYSVKKQS